MNYPVAYVKLHQFVRKDRGKRRFQFTDNTRLEKDLRITGDDAVVFMESFFSAFAINPSGFTTTKYFHQEGVDSTSISGLLKRMMCKSSIVSPVYDLSVEDLCWIMVTTKWVDPVV